MELYYAPQDPEHIARERRKARELRASQWWRQQVGPGLCYHCGERFPKEQLTMDHLLPISRGGKTTKNNVVPACKACNTEKANSTRAERTLASLSLDDAE